MDLTKDLIEKTIQHVRFGEGTICGLDDNIISVRFSSEIKKFVYPDAFKNHLVLTDTNSKKSIDKMLAIRDEKLMQEKENAKREEERRNLFKSLVIKDNSQVAFGFVENEKQKVLDSWIAFSGTYRTGNNSGKPRGVSRMHLNSACLLTYCEKGESEDTRYIFGIFMVREDFVGSACEDGMIAAHPKYRILFDDKEAKQLQFWKYFADKSKNKNSGWGMVEIKYLPNSVMAKILYDILAIHKNTHREKECQDFFNYYCSINKIDKKALANSMK